MATYVLFTASYGSNYANLRVRILEQNTGVPAIIMASATSGILSEHGNALLDSSGNLSVYLDNAKTFQVWNNQFLLTPSGISLATEVQRNSTQLATTPTLSDIGLGLGATFFLDTNPAAQYRISADKTAYTLITGSGGGGSTTFAALTDKATATIATTNTSVATALTNKLSFAANWNASTNVVTGVAGLTALANSAPGAQTIFQNTASGTTTVNYLGSITSVNQNDQVGWNSITGAWVLFPYGTGFSNLTGVYSDNANLVATFAGKVSTGQIGVANGIAGLGSDGKVPSAQLPTGSGGGAWGGITGTLSSQTDLQAALDAKEGTLAPVALTGATTLTRASHANRQLTFTGANATLTVQVDSAGGTLADDYFEVHTLTGSAGVPTLSTPDGKTITGSPTKIIGVTHKATDSWTAGTTDPAAGSGGGTTVDIASGTTFRIQPAGPGSVSVSTFGNPGNSLVGTLTLRTGIITGVGYKSRLGVVSGAAASSNAYYSTTTANQPFIMPDTATTWIPQPSRYVFTVSDALTSCRTVVGLVSGVPGTTVEPSALLNGAFFGADSTDTQLTFMTNNGSGTATKITLNGGAGFPCNTNTADAYECYINLRGGATPAIDYYIINRCTNVKASGTVTTKLPVATTTFNGAVFRNTAANTTACGIDFMLISGGGDAQMGATS